MARGELRVIMQEWQRGGDICPLSSECGTLSLGGERAFQAAATDNSRRLARDLRRQPLFAGRCATGL